MPKRINDFTTKKDKRYIKSFQWCFYCQSKTTVVHVEHIIPLAKGGSSDLSNLTGSCRRCNCYKHTLTMVEFLSNVVWKRNLEYRRFHYHKNNLRRLRRKNKQPFQQEFLCKKIRKLVARHSYLTRIIDSITNEKYRINV